MMNIVANYTSFQICLFHKKPVCANEYQDNPDSCLYVRVMGAGEVEIATHRQGISI